jgi:hypothetical protein
MSTRRVPSRIAGSAAAVAVGSAAVAAAGLAVVAVAGGRAAAVVVRADAASLAGKFPSLYLKF